MSVIRKCILGCAVAVSTLLPIEAGAMPAGSAPLAVEKQSDVTKARIVCDYWGCQRVYRPRHYGRPRYYEREAYRPRRVYSRHVQWCLDRYRSYDPSTNEFLAYDGVYKVCRSPWG